MTSSRFGVSAIIAGLVLVAGVQPARGTFVTFAFEGVVDSITDITHQIFPHYVNIGSPLTGTFTINLDTPDSEPDDPLVGLYRFAPVRVQGRLGTLDFAMEPASDRQIRVANDLPFPSGPRDSYQLRAESVAILDWRPKFLFELQDSTGAAFASDALPAILPPMELLTAKGFGFGGGTFPTVSGDIVSVTVIPEPGAIVLFAFGVTWLVWRRGRRG